MYVCTHVQRVKQIAQFFFSKLQQSNYYKVSNTTYISILYKKAYIYVYLCVLYITCVHVLIKLIVPKNYKIRGSKGEREILHSSYVVC
jgi:hypothetical protein